MQMTQQEIVTSFREAKDKREQIKILSQLNVCSEEEIRSILIKGGIDGRALPRKKRKEPFELEEKEPTVTPAAQDQAEEEAEQTGQETGEIPAAPAPQETAGIVIPDLTNVQGQTVSALKKHKERKHSRLVKTAIAFFIESLQDKIRACEEEIEFQKNIIAFTKDDIEALTEELEGETV